MKKSLRIFFVFLALILCFQIPSYKNVFANENEFESTAKSYIVMEEGSQQILYSKDADKKLPMASITKVMTLNLVLDEIEKGKLSLETDVTISHNSAKQTGSQAFLDEGKVYKLKDLLKSVVISSANDSAVALAECVSGSEKTFVERMNKTAKEMNLTNTHFSNSTGLPAPDHYSTARDIAVMFKKLSKNPLYLKYSKIWMDSLIHSSGRKTELVNTNRLIKTTTDVDGGKTGYTDEAGYCLVAHAKRNGMNLIAVVLGAKDSKDRFESVKTLFNLGFTNFEVKDIIKCGDIIGTVKVIRGKEKILNVVTSEGYSRVVHKESNEEVNIRTNIIEKVKAPISMGQKLGELEIVNEKGDVIKKIDLIAEKEIQKAKFKNIFDTIKNEW